MFHFSLPISLISSAVLLAQSPPPPPPTYNSKTIALKLGPKVLEPFLAKIAHSTRVIVLGRESLYSAMTVDGKQTTNVSQFKATFEQRYDLVALLDALKLSIPCLYGGVYGCCGQGEIQFFENQKLVGSIEIHGRGEIVVSTNSEILTLTNSQPFIQWFKARNLPENLY